MFQNALKPYLRLCPSLRVTRADCSSMALNQAAEMPRLVVHGVDGLPAVKFVDVLPDELYVASFRVRNTGLRATRIRMKAPQSRAFTLKYTPAGAVAPGLDVAAEVEFCVPEGADFSELRCVGI
eukprot:scaffold343_cov245-Pinguiococcus_pyrenoidosus.AAC.32